MSLNLSYSTLQNLRKVITGNYQNYGINKGQMVCFFGNLTNPIIFAINPNPLGCMPNHIQIGGFGTAR